MQETIVFSPDVDERQLDREVGKVDTKLQGVGEISPTLNDGGLDGVSNGVGGDSASGGVPDSLEGIERQLTGRLPKPMAGVLATKAMPVGLAGGVGMGMLSAMQSSSARLQTSASLLRQAWTTVWRPLGDRLDDLFIRDAVEGVLESTRNFEELVRGSFDADSLREGTADRVRALGELADILPGSFGDIFSDSFSLIGDVIDPDSDLGVWDFISTETRSVWDWTATGTRSVWDWTTRETRSVWDWTTHESRSVWDWITRESRSVWEWTTTESRSVWGWTQTRTRSVWDWTRTTTRSVWSWTRTSSRSVWSWITTETRSIWEFIEETGSSTRGRVGGAADDAIASGRDRLGLQRGGVINRPRTVTAGEAGSEIITPIAEMRRMMESVAQASQNSGNSGGLDRSDVREITSGLDTLHRDLKKLGNAMQSLEFKTDNETLARATSKGRNDAVFGTNSLV